MESQALPAGHLTPLAMDLFGDSLTRKDASPISKQDSNGRQSKSSGKGDRVIRACDRCNWRRVKCNGQQPCQRCKGQHICEFTRELKKRGRHRRSTAGDPHQPRNTYHVLQVKPLPMSTNLEMQHVNDADIGLEDHQSQISGYEGNSTFADSTTPSTSEELRDPHATSNIDDGPSPVEIMSAIEPPRIHQDMNIVMDYTNSPNIDPLYQTHHDHPLDNPTTTSNGISQEKVLYPALEPLMPYISSFLSFTQASSLLELYFTSAFDVYMHPYCRHIHGFFFRKSTVLDVANPRRCKPALLASMLLVAAETGSVEMLSWTHVKRKRISHQLHLVTIQLLRPLIHFDPGCAQPSYSANETGVGRVQDCNCTSRIGRGSTEENGKTLGSSVFTGTEPSIDDVITYIHVASITSASEDKAASMRWWHIAFTIARELKLNKESTQVLPSQKNGGGNFQMNDLNHWTDMSLFDFDISGIDLTENGANATNVDTLNGLPHFTEEQQEERRRVWWLLYIMDRHLALCYNRPLALLDTECEDLLLPMDERAWHLGVFPEASAANNFDLNATNFSVAGHTRRPKLSDFECSGHSVFGFFLPLMAICGEIIDLNHAKSHPLTGLAHRNPSDFQNIESEILRQLLCYENSLHAFELFHTGNHASYDPVHRDISHTKTVVAYATHTLHVLHILLSGKWDPVSLFDDEDCWISSPSFTSTVAHAVAAADAVEKILDLDPEISFMSRFTGIQLLQGSFVLLFIIDRLQTKADQSTINACEVIIRATEACVATLDTEYQRNYRQILRSAVAQAKGRGVAQKEAQLRRRAVLALYRWTRNGTGLAL